MKHNYALEGYGYKLRPVRTTDAQFIIDTRSEDAERSQFIHAISRDVSMQEKWIQNYYEREGDYYFVVENRLTGNPEGLISFYNVKDGSAEWGRWVIRKGSWAAAESVLLLYKIAFDQVGLKELFCRTITDNTSVVSFHNAAGEHTRKILSAYVELNGKKYDVIEQYADRKIFAEEVLPKLELQAHRIFQRNLKKEFKNWEFHHIGVATKSIEKEFPIYSVLGYSPEGDCFVDKLQGIRGLFITAPGQPRLELLENLPGRTTLDGPLRSGNKMYHIAYTVQNIETVVQTGTARRWRILSPLKESTYFGKRICFVLASNMQMIELIEE